MSWKVWQHAGCYCTAHSLQVGVGEERGRVKPHLGGNKLLDRRSCLLTLNVSQILWKDWRILERWVRIAEEVLASCAISSEAPLGGVFHSGNCTEAFQHWH